ncbi:sigma-70 family RNA polymerase sigma factor [Streptomyces canus]|uniref:sigma-70 family RNA polymerase sigma factor n=1 Tax=Streptomyces canus TaxID=58343 RepID=UPI0027851239|nr:sigma-70 family RNA polymerase sigma factor [Streptomyces canus]MDQ0762813.1 RNA polymerase sigma factor (sigma-70 family) [Streptomyces canus]
MRNASARPTADTATDTTTETATRLSGTDLVNAARSGDPRARAALFSEYLPLVYNVVGRGLHGHADVDDVVQETMLSAMRALPRLREPERFRSWIVAIAIRQIHDHGRRSKATVARQQPLADVANVLDPSRDLAELTVDRQALSQAGSDLLEASRWLSHDERWTLALWWQETAGQLTRTEVADALHLSVPHTAVRIQRMKAKLRVAIGVLAAWRARPRCSELESLGGGPTAAGQRRLTKVSRHVAACPRCKAAAGARHSIDDLPIRIGALAVPAVLVARIPNLVGQHGVAAGPVSSLLSTLPHGLGRVTVKSAVAVGSTVTLAAVLGLAIHLAPQPHPHANPAMRSPTPTPTPIASAPQSPGQTSAASDTATRTPSSTPSTALRAYSGVATADYYVAPGGDDANPGTLARPFATVTRAAAKAGPGQTVAVRGGTYHPEATIVLKSSGTANHRITVSNYRGEHPVLDGSRIPASAWFIVQSGGYVTVQGLEIVNAPNAPYVCESCHNDVFARLGVHGNGQTGLVLRGAGTRDNLVLNSDFFDNHESGSTGGYVDGLVFRDGSGTGNRIQGCRMYDNSGDGVDLSGFSGAVTVDHTWSFGNGVNRWGTATFSGGGSGFKLGGDSGLAAADIASDSASWDNAGFGFTEVGNAGAPLLTNDTAFRNGQAGFAFVSSAATLQHNLALANHPDSWLGDQAQHAGNSWDQSGWTTQVLHLTDPTSTTAHRGPDGQLPSTPFLSNTKNPTIGATLTR